MSLPFLSRRMRELTVLDWYTNKYITVHETPEEIFSQLKIGDKIIYAAPEMKSGTLKNTIWTIIQLKALQEQTHQEGNFIRILEGEEKAEFDQQQQLALKIFPTFKKEFKAEFPNSIPITVRFQIFSDQLFFFFFSEERYVFTEFVKRFREKLGMNIFLFQVGAREIIRMSPEMDGMFGSCGNSLCCKSYRMLGNADVDAVLQQNLEGRDIERLKGRCGKLKCCLLYELDLYIQESKNYPHKGSKINMCKLTNHCKEENCQAEECQGFVTSYNIITQEVQIKTKDSYFRIPISDLKNTSK